MKKNETNSDAESVAGEDKDSTNFKLIYSPRTSYSKKLDREEELYNDLTLNFDPITIKIIKKHFKERLGSLNNMEFISILKNHLLSWHPNHPNREKILVKLLIRLFSEIDLNDNGSMEWAEFTNYIIHNSNALNRADNKGENLFFKLRFYSEAKNTIDIRELSDNLGYATYIEKLSMIVLVENDKSVLNFYDANSMRKLKCTIDVKEIQKLIDDLELKELDEKAEKFRQLEREERAKQKLIAKENNRRIEKNNRSKYRKDSHDSDSETEKKKQNSPISKPKKSSKSPSRSKKDEILISKPSMKSLSKGNSEQTSHLNKLSMENLLKRNALVSKSVNKKMTILSTIFLPEYDVLLVSASNNRISAWKFANGEFTNCNKLFEPYNIDKHFFSCCILTTPSPQYTMAWDNLQKNLYTGQLDGQINKWDLTRSMPNKTLDHKKKDKNETKDVRLTTVISSEDSGHISHDVENKAKNEKRDSVSYMLVINKIQLLAVSYFNGSIILWDTLQDNKRKCYNDHKTGIYCMSYDSTKNLLFSCGFNHDILVYDPYIQFPVYKLSGHYGSINTVVCNEKESELISLDIYGNLKIWDTNLLINFQTMNLNSANEGKPDSNSNIKMLYLKKNKKIMVYGGTKIKFFETDKSLNPDLADDHIIFASFFDRSSKSIISFCLRKIKFWNPFTGKVKKVYEDPMKNEITAFTVDRNMKRVFLGDNKGNIKNFNMKNGKFLKNLQSHKGEINILLHSLSMNIVVSCSVDNVIKIHDDRELTESNMIKEIKIVGFQIKNIVLLESLKRLAIGLSNGLIKFYDIEHYRYDSDLNSETRTQNDEVVSLYNFSDVELVLSSHISGSCRFMVNPPSIQKFFSFGDFVTDERNIPVTCFDFDYENKLLFCGSLLGGITCFSAKDIFDLIETYELPKDKNPLMLRISKEFCDEVKNVSVVKIWTVDAHQESIKHLNFTNIFPNLVISTSTDLRVRIFSAENGDYIDELKQISNKYNPVPVGIVYKGFDPLSNTSYKETVWRKDLAKIGYTTIDDIEENNTAEYSNKITIFNAKEKLMQHIKNTNVNPDQSNNWNLMIDTNNYEAQEQEALKETYQEVKEKEVNILKTEMIMQQKSIYHESYKPIFINEMNQAELKEFSKTLSQKLRNVKLALSKANMGSINLEKLESPSREESSKTKNKEKLKPVKRRKSIIAEYIAFKKKDMSPKEIFETCRLELNQQIMDLQKPFQILIRKTKIPPIKSKVGRLSIDPPITKPVIKLEDSEL